MVLVHEHPAKYVSEKRNTKIILYFAPVPPYDGRVALHVHDHDCTAHISLHPSPCTMLNGQPNSAIPLQWGCSHCDAKNTDASIKNFRASCKHIICEQCVLGAVNRNKLLTRKTSERKASSTSVIEVTCPCVRCRGTVQVSQSWYEGMNARVISLCNDDKDGQEAIHYTAAVEAKIGAGNKTEINSKIGDDQQQLVTSGIERGGLKPLFEKGDAVYALWEESGTWHPGKIISYKQIDSKSRYGDARKYVVKFDDGDVGSTDDYNVFLAEDYLLHLKDKDEWKWKGVENKTDKRSSDGWARAVGWYVANIDGETQHFSTLVGALRAYDGSVLKKMGNVETNECDLNLPHEHRDTSPNRKGSNVNVVTPLQLPPLLLDSGEEEGEDDDDESRFSDIEIEQRESKRIKLDKRTRIILPPHLDGLQNDFWLARPDVVFTEDAFKKKLIFHLNSFVDASMKDNKGFGLFVEHGIATPGPDDIPEDIVSLIPEMTQNELRQALIQCNDWGQHFENSRHSGAG